MRQPRPNPYRDQEVLIIADRNFNTRRIGIANSEVLFLQYMDAGLAGFRTQALKRQFIQNDETLEVTAESFRRHHVNPDLSDRTLVYRYGDRDLFAALLGTPNGRAAAYLVIDHGEELDIIGIDRIEHHKRDDKENMYIYFRAA